MNSLTVSSVGKEWQRGAKETPCVVFLVLVAPQNILSDIFFDSISFLFNSLTLVFYLFPIQLLIFDLSALHYTRSSGNSWMGPAYTVNMRKGSGCALSVFCKGLTVDVEGCQFRCSRNSPQSPFLCFARLPKKLATVTFLSKKTVCKHCDTRTILAGAR